MHLLSSLRRSRRVPIAAALAALSVLCLLFAGCGGGGSENRAESEQGVPEANRGLPAPKPESTSPGSAVSAAGLAYEPPADWVSEEPTSSMRIAQYRLPAGGDSETDGLVTVFHFGVGGGGALDANLRRWANQFQQDDGVDPLSRAKIDHFDAANLKVTTIELTGRYVTNSTMGGGVPRDESGWRLIGAVLEGPGGPWFFKGVGPEQVMLDHRDGFISLLRGARSEA